MFTEITEIVKTANQYGFPLPVLIIILIVYKVIISKISWWTKREDYYKIVLTSLGKWREGLSIGLECFIEPGSEYRNDFQNSINFKTYWEYSGPAQKILKENMHFGRLFLSRKSVEIIDELFGNEWELANMSAVNTKDYLEKTLEIVTTTYDSILDDATKDLQSFQKREILGAFFNRK